VSETPPEPSESAKAGLPEDEVAALREAGRSWSLVPRARVQTGRDFVEPDLGVLERRGRAGEHYVRVVRPKNQGFKNVAPGWLEATARATAPTSDMGRFAKRVRGFILGQPLATAQQESEKLTKVKALAVLSSDALSSVAYATEQILVVLVVAGSAATQYSLPIMGAIVFLLCAVVLSYRQTIKAYPAGGGSYIVAKDNLGPLFGLVAAAALMTDYVLTVAVSVSSGKDFVASSVPWVGQHGVPVCIGIIVLIVLGNLRGIRESGSIFAAPTYLFIFGIFVMLIVGFIRLATHSTLPVQTAPLGHAIEGVGVLLILKAFASGCTALTGVEAISDGVPAFKPPGWHNARTTLTVMGLTLGTMFVGITVGAHLLGLHPYKSSNPPIIVQFATAAFGSNSVGLYFVTWTTAAILVLAANTSFSDFPRLFFFLARDDYAPHQFRRLGERLAFNNGIVVLAAMAILLVWVFGARVDSLIPLYTIGVFLAFTMSQGGMVMRWLRRREPGWRRGLPLNAVGMSLTALVFIITAAAKFTSGAWVVLIIIPTFVTVFYAIHRHYQEVATHLTTEIPISPADLKPVCIVPIAELNGVAMQSLAMARAISDSVIAVHICDDEHHIERLRAKWEIWGNHVPLEIVESPYRSFIRPLLRYIDAIDKQHGDDTIIIVLPELVATRWWHALLHNQTALRLKAQLLFRPGTVVINVPYHLQRAPHVRRIRRRGDGGDDDIEAI
jgi:amino acid transporter